MINITEKFGKGGNLMTKKKFTEEELRFNEDIKKIVLDILEKNKKPMIKIEVLVNLIYFKVNLEDYHICQKIRKHQEIKRIDNLHYLLK